MSNKALVVIDIQNDITKHYKDIIDNINAAIDWAVSQGMTVIYIKHNNLSPGTRTFKPDTKGGVEPCLCQDEGQCADQRRFLGVHPGKRY